MLDAASARGDHETALRIAGALGWYWSGAHHEEGTQRLAGVLAQTANAPPTLQLARALQAMALLEAQAAPSPAAMDAARRSLELFERFGDQQAAATSKVWLAVVQLQLLGGGDARRLLEEAEAAFSQHGDAWGEALAWLGRFMVEAILGPPRRAAEFGRRALERFRALDDQWGHTWSLFQLGLLSRAHGDIAGAVRRHEEAAAVARDGGPVWILCASLIELVRFRVPHTLGQLGCAEARLGALDDAGTHLHEAATLIAGRSQPLTAALLLVGLAWVALGRGDAERAALLLGAADATRERTEVAPVGAEQHEAELARQAARSRLGEHAFKAATTAGRGQAADQALQAALPGKH